MDASDLKLDSPPSEPPRSLPRICHLGRDTAQWAEIRRSIERRCLDVGDAVDVEQLFERYAPGFPELIVIGEGGQQPHELCQELRRRDFAGLVMVITADGDPVEPILALESGADAWAPADADPRTAVAQIRALLRRTESPIAAKPVGRGDLRDTLRVGDCVLSNLSRECRIGGRPVHLTGREFQLLWILASRAGAVVSREELSRALGYGGERSASRSVDCCVSRMRRRLGDAWGKNIRTIHAVGYLLSSAAQISERSLGAPAARYQSDAVAGAVGV